MTRALNRRDLLQVESAMTRKLDSQSQEREALKAMYTDDYTAAFRSASLKHSRSRIAPGRFLFALSCYRQKRRFISSIR